LDNEAKDIFNQIERNTNISMDEIYNIAHSIQYKDLSDEATVRDLVQQLSRLANRPISQQKEDEIVHSIINNRIPSSIESLQRLFD